MALKILEDQGQGDEFRIPSPAAEAVAEAVVDDVLNNVLEDVEFDVSEESKFLQEQERRSIGSPDQLAASLHELAVSQPVDIPASQTLQKAEHQEKALSGTDMPKLSVPQEDMVDKADIPTLGQEGIPSRETRGNNDATAQQQQQMALQPRPDQHSSSEWAALTRSTAARSQMRSRLLKATQREADARMEAQMLAVDATDMHEQLLHMSSALLAEQHRSSGLEARLADKEAEVSRLTTKIASLQERAENMKGLKEVYKRAQRAEQKAAVLEEQLKVFATSAHLDYKASQIQLAQKYGSEWEIHMPAPPTHSNGKHRKSASPARFSLKGQQAHVDPQITAASGESPTGHIPAMPMSGEAENRQAATNQASPGHGTAQPAREFQYTPSPEVAALQDVLHRANNMNRPMLRRAWHDEPENGPDSLNSTQNTGAQYASQFHPQYREARGSVVEHLGPSGDQPCRHSSGRFRSSSLGGSEIGYGSLGHARGNPRNWRRRPSSPTYQMEQLLKQVDTTIAEARKLPDPPIRTQTYGSDPTGTRTQHRGHNFPQYHHPEQTWAPQSTVDPGTGHQYTTGYTGQRQYEEATDRSQFHGASQPHQRARSAVPHGTHDSAQAGMMSCSQYLQQARPPGSPRSPGRRAKYVRPRQSASEVIPPERVAEEALRTTRMEYFADLQRIQQKRMRDGSMF